MTSSCASLDPSLLTRLSDYVECQAEAASRSGFETQGGALAAALLSGCLLIYVALIGYRMMLGQTYDARGALVSAARAGLVIALASSWASYQPLVQTVVLSGPTEIAAALLRPSGLEVRTPAQAAKDLRDLRRPVGAQPPPPTTATANSADASETRSSIAGAWLALRLAAGILLGLGPLLIPLALFDTALGLVEGWVRSLVGVLLGSAAVLIIASVEHGFLQAELARDAGGASGPLDLGPVSTVFSVAAWVALAAMVGIAWCFRFGRLRLPTLAPAAESHVLAGSAAQSEPRRIDPALSEPARARSVAQAVLAHGRRERAVGQTVTMTVHAGGPTSAPSRGGGQDHADTLGARRSAAPRRTLAARRRESGS